MSLKVRINKLNFLNTKFNKIWDLHILNIIEKAKSFFKSILFDEQYTLSDKGSLKYWKDMIFYIISIAMLTVSAPLLFMGAYMFYINGYNIVYSIVEVLMYFIIAAVITRRSLSVSFRKIFINLVLYFIGVLLLITTGIMGAGLVIVLFSLILTGLLLEKRQILQVVAINIIIFTGMTVLLMNGYFDGSPMEKYKEVWFINVIASQVCGIILLFIVNTIYSGLENQAQLISKSKEILRESEQKYKEVVENIPIGIVTLLQGGK
jgi:hypothetical protein